MKVIIDRDIPFVGGLLEPYAEVLYQRGELIDARAAADCDAMLIRTRTRCDAALLDSSRVRFIATATIGYDHIDTRYCREHAIEVRRAEGCNARGVLQWVAGALAHLLAADHLTPDRCTLGIVGVGHIGSLVERYARHWGFRVLCCDPPRQAREGGDFIPLDELAARADILTFHTPLDDTTRCMVDGRLLSLTRPGAIILNASRGEVVDGRALLASGRRYVLDVWEHEPHIDRSVLDGALYATTHIAGQGQCLGSRDTQSGRAVRPAAQRVVSAAGRPRRAAAYIVERYVPHDRQPFRHRSRDAPAARRTGSVRTHTQHLRLPAGVFLARKYIVILILLFLSKIILG